MKYLPSNKILILLLILGLGLAGWFWLPLKTAVPKNAVFNQTREKSSALNNDGDGDGLKDWEEELWRTEPDNPDTDGDGTLDGQEIRERRDPLAAGPDDKYEGLLPQTADILDLEAGFNFTEQFSEAFSRTMGPRILQARGLDPAAVEILPELLPEREELLGEVPEIKRGELQISSQNDPAAVKKYFNQVYGVYEKTFLTLKKDDIAILAQALANEDLSGIGKIDEVIYAFEESFRQVKKIPVPKSEEDFALAELNYLLKSKRLVEIIRNADRDPLRALAVLDGRIKLMKEIKKFHNATGQNLSEKGISFGPKEGAYRLFQ